MKVAIFLAAFICSLLLLCPCLETSLTALQTSGRDHAAMCSNCPTIPRYLFCSAGPTKSESSSLTLCSVVLAVAGRYVDLLFVTPC